jgi:ribose/xylose/arabinose/galactoside ABC-type transport system permease subunit
VFAAVVIGGASLTGGRGTVFGTLMGAVLLAILSNGLAIMGVGAFARLIFVGLVTIGAVALDVLAQRAARRAEMRAG